MLSLLTLAVIAAAASVIYMMSAFRIGPAQHGTPHGFTSAQPAKTLPVDKSLPVAKSVPLNGQARCVMMVIPRTCTAWSSGTGKP